MKLILLSSYLILSSILIFPTCSQGFFFKSNDEKTRDMLQDFNTNEYYSLSASEKMNKLWKQIKESDESYGYFGILKLGGMLLHNNNSTFDHYGDVLPNGRDKLIHTTGVIHKVEFMITNKNNYSGIFHTGSKYGLLRLSAAKEYNHKKSTPDGAENNFVSGFGLKFLIDGHYSEGLVAMFNPVGYKSWNFFSQPFTNSFRIEEETDMQNTAVSRSFSRVTPWISSVGLRGISSVHEDGTVVENPKYPFRLHFEPNPKLKSMFKDEFTEDYKEILKRIPKNTIIYEVYAIDNPGCEPEKIGELISRSEVVTSRFADKDLFFRHGKIEFDDELYPERTEARDSFSFFGGLKIGSEPKVSNKRCPFGF